MPFSSNKIAWIEILHHCQCVWIKCQVFMKNLSFGDFKTAFRTTSTFSGDLVVLEGPALLFDTLPVSIHVFIYSKIDFRPGTQPAVAILNCFLNSNCIAIIEWPLKKYVAWRMRTSFSSTAWSLVN